MNRSMVLLIAGVLGTFLSTRGAKADPIVTPGNHPQTGEENILLNSGNTSTTVQGTTNTSNITVDFTSTQTLTEPSSGQARVEAASGLLYNITISIPDGYYSDLIINPFSGRTAPGTAFINVITNDGGPTTFPETLSNGNNFFTITTTPGEVILSTTLEVPNGFGDLRQPRISGATVGPTPPPNPNVGVVPEPRSLLLWVFLGLGLVAYGVVRSLRERLALRHS